MLRRILTVVIAVLLTVTGLILMEQMLPNISFLLGYNVHSKGLLGYSYIHWLFAILSVLFFSWVGWVITPFIIKYLLKYSELVASVLAKAPSADIIVSLIGVLIGLILANLIGAPFSRLPHWTASSRFRDAEPWQIRPSRQNIRSLPSALQVRLQC